MLESLTSYDATDKVAKAYANMYKKQVVTEAIDTIDKANTQLLKYSWHPRNLEKVKAAIKNGADVHINNDEALIQACERGYFDIVKYLVDKGANIHAEDDAAIAVLWENSIGGLTSHPDDKEYVDILKYLIKKGVDINIMDGVLLAVAAEFGNIELIEWLKNNGLKINDSILKDAIKTSISIYPKVTKYLENLK